MNIQKTHYNPNFQGLLNGSITSKINGIAKTSPVTEIRTGSIWDDTALKLFSQFESALATEKNIQKRALIKLFEDVSDKKFNNPDDVIIYKNNSNIVLDGKDDFRIGTLLTLDTNA